MATEQSPVLVRHIRRLVAVSNYERLSDQELLEYFASRQDEAAFAALMRRDGARGPRVAQRVLQNAHDAEDVCQAAFLVLARKASLPCWHGSVASWLHGVAYRLALKARTAAARRRRREGKAAARTAEDVLAQITAPELVQGVDQGLARLAEKHRAPLVLCCLEGNTQDEAAQRLAWPLSTLKLRLGQGREMLRRRLARRGLTLGAVLSAVVLGEGGASAALPAALTSATVR